MKEELIVIDLLFHNCWILLGSKKAREYELTRGWIVNLFWNKLVGTPSQEQTLQYSSLGLTIIKLSKQLELSS